MKIKHISDPFPPLHIQVGDYPLSVYRVESSPRLRVTDEQEKQNTVFQTLHMHFTYEVFFVVHGTLELLTEKGRSRHQKAMVLIPPQIHHVTIRDGESYCLLFSFDSDSTLSQYLEEGVCELPLSEENAFYIRQLANKTMLRTQEAEQSVHYLASLIFHDILNTIRPQIVEQSQKRSRSAQHISRIDEYINKNYRRRITVSELANSVHLSERQVARIIRQEYRCSFTELLNNRRLANAVSMLKNTNLSIAQIIERTFYCSPNYFYRVFRKKYGISPLQYRKQIRTPYAGNMVIDQN